MLRTDLALQEACDRQAALRRHTDSVRRQARSGPVRRRVGAWIVRLGRAVAGRPATAPWAA